MDHAMNQKVALFVTCLVDQMFPEIGVAAVKLLRRNGFEVAFPEQQTCCGQPFYSSGFLPEARQLARQTIEIIEDFSAVVIPGGSCTGMIAREYVHLFKDDPAWQTRALAASRKCFELSDFLVANVVLRPKDGVALPVTYHDSCHMLRIMGIKDQPRLLLEQVGCDVREMEESERCCGFGGLFSVRMRQVSQAMTGTKLSRAAGSGAQVLVTSDPGCLMQMRANLRPEDPLRIEHLAVVLEELAQ
jgi:L-lactate dehydrogenase complex protein LldE